MATSHETVPPAAAERRRRGPGRNLPAAIGVGVVLAALVLGTLFTYRFGFVVLLVVAISIAVWELVRAVGRAEARPPLVPLLAGVLAMDLLAWFRGAGALAVAFLLTALACVVWRLADGPVGYLRDTSTAVFVALYVPFLAGFAVLLAVPDDGAPVVLTGGGGRSGVVQQLLADALRRPVRHLRVRSASATGAAMLAARGVGLDVTPQREHGPVVEPRRVPALDDAARRWAGR